MNIRKAVGNVDFICVPLFIRWHSNELNDQPITQEDRTEFE